MRYSLLQIWMAQLLTIRPFLASLCLFLPA